MTRHAMTRTPPRTWDAENISRVSRRAGLWAGLGLVCAAAAALVALGWLPEWVRGGMATEGGPVEALSLLGWMVLVGMLVVHLPRQRTVRDRWHLGWLAVLASLAALRELDAHVLLNPEALGAWGVRYRIDWWLDAASPVVGRLGWALGGLVVAAAVVVPPFVFRARVIALLRRRDGASALAVLGAGLIAFGYASDDLFGRDLLLATPTMQLIEESAELAAVGVFVLMGRLVTGRPLAVREGRAGLSRSAGSSGRGMADAPQTEAA